MGIKGRWWGGGPTLGGQRLSHRCPRLERLVRSTNGVGVQQQEGEGWGQRVRRRATTTPVL